MFLAVPQNSVLPGGATLLSTVAGSMLIFPTTVTSATGWSGVNGVPGRMSSNSVHPGARPTTAASSNAPDNLEHRWPRITGALFPQRGKSVKPARRPPLTRRSPRARRRTAGRPPGGTAVSPTRVDQHQHREHLAPGARATVTTGPAAAAGSSRTSTAETMKTSLSCSPKPARKEHVAASAVIVTAASSDLPISPLAFSSALFTSRRISIRRSQRASSSSAPGGGGVGANVSRKTLSPLPGRAGITCQISSAVNERIGAISMTSDSSTRWSTVWAARRAGSSGART